MSGGEGLFRDLLNFLACLFDAGANVVDGIVDAATGPLQRATWAVAGNHRQRQNDQGQNAFHL